MAKINQVKNSLYRQLNRLFAYIKKNFLQAGRNGHVTLPQLPQLPQVYQNCADL